MTERCAIQRNIAREIREKRNEYKLWNKKVQELVRESKKRVDDKVW